MGADGWVIIGTDLDTKKFEDKMKNLEKKIERETEKKQKVEIEIDLKSQELKEYDKQMTNLAKKAEEAKNKVGEINAKLQKGEAVTPREYLDLEKYEAEYRDMIAQSAEVEKSQERVTKELTQQQEKLSNINNRLEDYNQKVQNLRFERHQKQLQETNNSIGKIGKSINTVIKRVVRWGLAVFGIRSAYFALRSAMSTLSQYDEKLATDIEYIKYSLAMTLEPIIKAIVNLVYTLLQYVGYLAKAWFNIDIFGKSSVKNFKNTNKEAQKLNKTIAGFDEMNVLNGDTGTSGGGGTAPSIDLSQVKGEVPEWLKTIEVIGKWIIDNWLEVIGLLSLTKMVIDALTGNWIGVAIDFIIFIASQIPRLVEAFKNVGSVLGNIFNVVLDVFGKIIARVVKDFKDMFNFFGGLVNSIVKLFKNIATTVGNVIGSAFKAVINAVLKVVETLLNTPIKAVNKLIGVINKVPGIDLGTLPTFNLPRLAKGGIVSMPGRGVMVGGALAGEGGTSGSREGVIPLTDSQQMELLGASIGKYITINANITNTMNGRVISRELQRVQNDNDFAFNR